MWVYLPEKQIKMASNTISKGLFWKLSERFGVSGIQFVLQIVLARILSPDHYGVLTLMVIFTNLANIFVQSGFNIALVQNKDVTDEDFSSVFWITLGVAFGIYGILFFTIPFIADFYKMPEIIAPFRVLALILIPGGLNSIQIAKISREFDFRKVFISNVGAVIISGTVGIAVAYGGGGIWALVLQSLTNAVLICVIMWFTVKFRPRFICNISRVKVLFSYGWKLLMSNLLETVYQEIHSLIVGVKYTSSTLGFYDRGKQFPQYIINAVNSAFQAVMLPAMSAKQDSKSEVKAIMRRSVMTSAFVIFPMMAGLAAVAPSVVRLLLTDKWLSCVPYMQIYCITFAVYPVHTCNLQAINAMGRSDLFLCLEIIKKIIGAAALAVAVFCFDSPVAIALTGVITTVISFFVNAYPNKKLIGYSFAEQAKDLMPQIILSGIMCGIIYGFNYLSLPAALILSLQIVSGVAVYVAGSALLRLDSFGYMLEAVKGVIRKRK